MNLIEVHIDASNKKALPANVGTVKQHLNKLTDETSGFTFCAQAIEAKNYEVCLHLYEPSSQQEQGAERKYLGPAFVSFSDAVREKDTAKLRIWVCRGIINQVMQHVDSILSCLSDLKMPVSAKKIPPSEIIRIRMIGQNAYDELSKVITDQNSHKAATEAAERRLPTQLGASIGRCLKDSDHMHLIYFNTHPRCVDLVLSQRQGKLLWHKLIKNKAHLVGGYRDVERLMTGNCFELKPDK